MQKENKLGVAARSAVYTQWVLPVFLAIAPSVYADTLLLPAGVPAPSFVNDMVLIDNPGNADDSTGYGGVSYKYRMSATQITVGDWVAFLNAIGATEANDLGLGSMTTSHPDCDNGWCASAFAYNGSAWEVTAFNANGMNLSAADAEKLPIDWLSLNNVARYLNWLATGSIDTGAFTFTDNGALKGNWPIVTFNDKFPGPRLPSEDELYKAMYFDKSTNGYNDYPTTSVNGSGEPILATSDPNTGLHSANTGGALIGSNGGGVYAKIRQEEGNPWGVYDVGGNRHESTLNPADTSVSIYRGAAAFGTIADAHRDTRKTLNANRRYVSIGYRVWMGVSAPAGTIKITKQVVGGTDPQAFSVNLDCTDDNFDKTGILIKAGAFYESNAIPAGTQCTVTETAPTAPTGFAYAAAAYTPAQIVTVGNGTVADVTITNTLQAAAAPKVDLEVTKVVDKPNVSSGETVVYTLTVTNESATDATGVRLNDKLPAGVTHSSDDSAGSYDKTTGEWVVGSLPKGENKVLNITVTVN